MLELRRVPRWSDQGNALPRGEHEAGVEAGLKAGVEAGLKAGVEAGVEAGWRRG